MNTKQVIVMRTDLGMRKGKMIAQGAHASISFLTADMEIKPGKPYFTEGTIILLPHEVEWVKGRFTKVCVRVDSEEELLDIHQQAIDAGLSSFLITDAGLTEFNGVPTNTCLAIGPDEAEKIDQITGHLRLL